MGNLGSLSVKNFGPINHAEINISPLTIFVGKNSSGKSFLSSLIHSFSNPFNHNSHRVPSLSLNYVMETNPTLFKDFENNLEKYLRLKPSFLDDSFEYSLDKFVSLINEGFGRCYTNLIENELKNNWKTTLNNLNRQKKYPFEIKFDEITLINANNKLINQNFENKIFELIKSLNLLNPIGINIATNENSIRINIDYSSWMNFYGDNETISAAQIVYVLVVTKLIEKLKFNSFYIPAGGEIFNDFNNYLANEVTDIIDSSTIQKEFIGNLLNINQGSQKGYFYDLACEMEDEINHGKILLRHGDLNDELIFIDEKHDLEFEMNLISSSIHELIPLIIYLKYYLNKNDVLIIEEIENHLHPENQLILVKYMVKAINKGLNIILTTHSDYIIEKFNNLIQLGNSKKEALNQLGYDEFCILDYHDVSIYNFKKNDDYSYSPNVIDINFTGFSDDNFSQVIDELSNESDIMDEFKIR